MPLPLNLTTNEVKNASGTEVEFLHFDLLPSRKKVYALSGEAPNLRHRLSVEHSETGAGKNRRRRSKVGVDIESLSAVDSTTIVTTRAYTVVDSPVGAMTTTAILQTAVAELVSFIATTGAGTTVLYDGTGTGAVALIQGSL